MSEVITIASHRGPYTADFSDEVFAELARFVVSGTHFIVDQNVARLYEKDLAPVLAHTSVLIIEATEVAKSLERMPDYVKALLACQIRRKDRLVAIGGGIIQDITCFLSATLFRGVDWEFFPTTLLAQADSCIGSKSSINVGEAKNILGTYTPPSSITISTRFLDTLTPRDLCSGIGEMLKVHAIDGPESFDRIARDYDRIFADKCLMVDYLRRSLVIKKRFIEMDEFDTGPRLVMNYGHSFGHALESATDFAIPHGVAVTIGMDMANFTAVRLGRLSQGHFDRMHLVLANNFAVSADVRIPLDGFLKAIVKDKKNTASALTLILPDGQARVERVSVPADATFQGICRTYFSEVMHGG